MPWSRFGEGGPSPIIPAGGNRATVPARRKGNPSTVPRLRFLRPNLINMKIGAALGFNLIDYPGRIAAVAFTPGCNYRCPHCHAAPLLGGAKDLGDQGFLDYLETVKEWVTGVAICGGEPTIQPGLLAFIEQVRSRNLAVKLDTNGGNPKILAQLLARNLVDYVAMDVKGPQALWSAATGVPGYQAEMLESLKIVASFPVYEFRTTVAPVIREGGNISFLTVPEMAATARLIRDTTGSSAHKYYVQKFMPRKDGLLDKRLETFPETPVPLLQEIHKEVLKQLPNTQLRG